jgi:hypothetical protein
MAEDNVMQLVNSLSTTLGQITPQEQKTVTVSFRLPNSGFFLGSLEAIKEDVPLTVDLSKTGIHIYALLFGKSVAFVLHIAAADCGNPILPITTLRFVVQSKTLTASLIPFRHSIGLELTCDSDLHNIVFRSYDGVGNILRETLVKTIIEDEAPDRFKPDATYTDSIEIDCNNLKASISAVADVCTLVITGTIINFTEDTDTECIKTNVLLSTPMKRKPYTATISSNNMKLIKRLCMISTTMTVAFDPLMPLRVNIVPNTSTKRRRDEGPISCQSNLVVFIAPNVSLDPYT